MPKGCYERRNTDKIREAAIARGATGFLHKPHVWIVFATSATVAEMAKTKVKKEALRHFRQLTQNAKYPGRYFGAKITITKDGKPFTP